MFRVAALQVPTRRVLHQLEKCPPISVCTKPSIQQLALNSTAEQTTITISTRIPWAPSRIWILVLCFAERSSPQHRRRHSPRACAKPGYPL